MLVSGITTAVEVTAGEDHTCALLQGGPVDCWGNDFYGELGNGHAGNGQSSSVPVAAEIFPTNPATEISAGGYDTCAVMQNRTVTCWGNGDHGQLGNGVVFPEDPSPMLVANITNATDVSTGLDYACAVRADGGVSCWGSDLNAQLGDRTHIAAHEHRRRQRPPTCSGVARRDPGQRRRGRHMRDARERHRGLLGNRDARRQHELGPAPVIGLPASWPASSEPAAPRRATTSAAGA